MVGHGQVLLKAKMIALFLAFVFIPLGLGYDGTTALAQQSPQNVEPMEDMNHTAFMHNPCFSHSGNHTHATHHGGKYGNQTSTMMHQYGQNGTHMIMGNGTHHFGNETSFKMPPCPSQNSTSTSTNGNSGVIQSSTNSSSSQIPSWVRNNAKWWSQNQVGDSDFIQGVQYLIQQGIMKIPTTQVNQTSSSQQIPAWVKTNAGWWASGQISDDDFIKGIQYLVSNGIVKID